MYIRINKYLNSNVDASPLIVFRIFFGLLMLISILRFWNNGWIETIYIEPIFHFKYYGFEWVRSFKEWNYLLFLICAISTLCITIGYKYKFFSVLFFLTFTYIELIDKTTYLNHYYFISIISFFLIFLPANCKFSLDTYLQKKECNEIPIWTIDVIKIMLFIVYFYAGIAKINSDWLLKAMPLSIWLPGKYDLLLVGSWMSEEWIHYLFSWGGMLYDLLIGFFLFSKAYRNHAYILVVIFHIMTAIFFPSIGMFPYIMIASAIIFLSSDIHKKIILFFRNIISIKDNLIFDNYKIPNSRKAFFFIIFLLFIQIIVPFRYLLYNGNIFWTEEGYRFSWRVMLMEKAGHTTFTVIDNNSNKREIVNNGCFLTEFQEKQMSFQPDLILEFAHYLGDIYKKKGFSEPSIYVDSYVTLNGRLSSRFIDEKVDLLKEQESFKQKTWVIPFRDEIKGF